MGIAHLSKNYLLRLYEILEIVTYQNQKALLNKRSELFCYFCYANKPFLENCTGHEFR